VKFSQKKEAEAKEERRKGILAEVKQIRDEDLPELLTIADSAFERATAYAGRLMLLGGGTITLTFTAIGAIESKLPAGHHLTHLRELFWAWSLLIVSMTCCIGSQKFLLAAGSEFMVNYLGKILLMRVSHVAQAATEFGHVSTLDKDASPVVQKMKKSEKTNAFRGRLGGIALIVAEGATVVAFVLLLLFMQANIKLAL